MDTDPKQGGGLIQTLVEVSRLHLYLLTLVAQVMSACIARWVLGWFAWALLGLLLPLPFDPQLVAYAFAFGPLVWSLCAFWQPGEGRAWHKRVGAFEPSEGEARLIDAAFNVLGPDATGPLRALSVYVVDTNDRFAFVRGQALVLSRGLVESSHLPAVLAHELGHACSTDGRLIQALDRLVLWGDPMGHRQGGDSRREHGIAGLLVGAGLRWFFWLASGSLTLAAFAPLWARYWRERERAADAYAVSLGQGPTLARYLEAWEQPSERPHPRLLFNLQEYERIAYRLDALRSAPATA